MKIENNLEMGIGVYAVQGIFGDAVIKLYLGDNYAPVIIFEGFASISDVSNGRNLDVFCHLYSGTAEVPIHVRARTFLFMVLSFPRRGRVRDVLLVALPIDLESAFFIPLGQRLGQLDNDIGDIGFPHRLVEFHTIDDTQVR